MITYFFDFIRSEFPNKIFQNFYGYCFFITSCTKLFEKQTKIFIIKIGTLTSKTFQIV